jgi:hypothetical protein
LQQPSFIGFGIRILPYGLLQDVALQLQADRVGSGVSLPLSAAALGGVERAEQLAADLSGTHGGLL